VARARLIGFGVAPFENATSTVSALPWNASGAVSVRGHWLLTETGAGGAPSNGGVRLKRPWQRVIGSCSCLDGGDLEICFCHPCCGTCGHASGLRRSEA